MGELGNEIFVKEGEGEQLSRRRRAPVCAAEEAGDGRWFGGGRADVAGERNRGENSHYVVYREKADLEI